MKRPWAFICAAATTKSDTLRRYCRALYTLGYVPVCPPIQDGQYLVLADPTERADYNEIVREKILRCPLLVLCGQKTDATTNASPACTACSRRPSGENPSPTEAPPAGEQPAGRFCKHSVWTSKRRFLGRAPNPRFKTIYERTW